MIKQKIHFLILCCILLCSLLCINFVYASTIQNDNYYFFYNASSLAKSDNLYVVENQKIDVFNNYKFVKSYDIPLSYAEKSITYNDNIFMLSDNTLHVLNFTENTFSTLENISVSDFAIFNDSLLVVSNGKIFFYNIDFSASTIQAIDNIPNIDKIVTHKNNIYFTSIISQNTSKVNVYLYDGTINLLSQWVNKPKKLLFTTQLLLGYQNKITSLDNKDIINNFCAIDYIVDDNSLLYISDMLEIVKFDLSNGQYTILLASASNQPNFYFNPHSVSSNVMNILVCDTFNNRVQISNTSTRYLNVAEPNFAIINTNNEFFVVSGKYKILHYDYNLNIIDEITLDKEILDFSIDSFDNLYIKHNDGIYKLESNKEKLFLSCETFYITDKNQCYYLYNNSIYEKDNDNKLFDIDFSVKNMIVDNSNNFFFLSDNNIIKINISGEKIEYQIPNNEYADYMTMSKFTNENINYGDLLICITDKHNIIKINKQDIGLNIYMGKDVNLSELDNEKILAITNFDTEVFPTPFFDACLTIIPKNTQIIVAKYNLDETNLFSYIYYSYKVGNDIKFTKGFVFKTKIALLTLDVPPISNSGLLLSDKKLYSYPTTFSPSVTQELPQGTTLALLTFYKYSNAEGSWYKAQTKDGVIGYILSNNISIHGYKPNIEMPHTNAKILSINGLHGAMIYQQINDDFIVDIDAGLIPVGANVEIVEKLDKSKPFTQILFYKEGLGTISCFVETDCLDYKGVTNVQIVAVVITILTLVLSTILIILKRNYHKK